MIFRREGRLTAEMIEGIRKAHREGFPAGGVTADGCVRLLLGHADAIGEALGDAEVRATREEWREKEIAERSVAFRSALAGMLRYFGGWPFTLPAAGRERRARAAIRRAQRVLEDRE